MDAFNALKKINVNDHTERKNGLTYLAWAWAWGELKTLYPESYYTVYENREGLCYHTDGRTCWVKTGVTLVDGDEKLEHIEYLPVMDMRNRSIPVGNVTSFDVNKAIQRSLTKAVARHGLGLYIYAGEDLPEDEAKERVDAGKYVQASTTPPERFQKPTQQPEETSNAVAVSKYNPVSAIKELMTAWQCSKDDFAAMRQALVDMGKITDKSSLDMTEADVQQLKAALDEVYGAA